MKQIAGQKLTSLRADVQQMNLAGFAGFALPARRLLTPIARPALIADRPAVVAEQAERLLFLSRFAQGAIVTAMVLFVVGVKLRTVNSTLTGVPVKNARDAARRIAANRGVLKKDAW